MEAVDNTLLAAILPLAHRWHKAMAELAAGPHPYRVATLVAHLNEIDTELEELWAWRRQSIASLAARAPLPPSANYERYDGADELHISPIC